MERWQQIESLFRDALERSDPAERDAWLREACRGDADLRCEVASLLANHQAASDSKPWAAAAAAKLIDRPTSLEPARAWVPIGSSLSWLPAEWAKFIAPRTLA
jgi:serine/threonine-protein kinase